jgi:hypothetical protein
MAIKSHSPFDIKDLGYGRPLGHIQAQAIYIQSRPLTPKVLTLTPTLTPTPHSYSKPWVKEVNEIPKNKKSDIVNPNSETKE